MAEYQITDQEIDLYADWVKSIATNYEEQAKQHTCLDRHDLFQEALLATVLALKDHDAQVNPDKKPLINKYVRQHLLNVIRHSKHTEVFVGVNSTMPIGNYATSVVDFLADMEDQCTQLEIEVFRLKFEGYKLYEIQQKLNINTKTFRKLIFRLNSILETLDARE